MQQSNQAVHGLTQHGALQPKLPDEVCPPCLALIHHILSRAPAQQPLQQHCGRVPVSARDHCGGGQLLGLWPVNQAQGRLAAGRAALAGRLLEVGNGRANE